MLGLDYVLLGQRFSNFPLEQPGGLVKADCCATLRGSDLLSLW